MKTYRITYTSASENIVEVEASNVTDAWKKITSGDFESDKDSMLIKKGRVTYKAKVTEEITRHIATNPSTITS